MGCWMSAQPLRIPTTLSSYACRQLLLLKT